MTNNPTCKQDLQVHAARLREMVETKKIVSGQYQQRWVEQGFHPENSLFLAEVARHQAEIAALLAGAEALEAVDKTRKLLDDYMASAISVRTLNTHEWMEGFVEDTNDVLEKLGDPDRVSLEHGSIHVRKNAALARLEGK
jgi:hypothetical protein